MFSVSVIVPNYNNGKYLSSCLNSIIAQTYPIKEIVVYDDCSTDGSREILADFAAKDERIKVIYGKKNVGVSIARDTAIQNTTSDYICMLDSDDYIYSPKKIQAEMDKIHSVYYETGEYVVCFSQTVDVDENGVPLKKVKYVDLSGKERIKIITRMYNKYMPRDYCFPKKYYDLCGGYNKNLSLYEDWELNIKLLEYTRFIYSGEFGTAYRHKDCGLSSVNYKKQFITKIKILNTHNITIGEKLIGYMLAAAAYIKYIVKG